MTQTERRESLISIFWRGAVIRRAVIRVPVFNRWYVMVIRLRKRRCASFKEPCPHSAIRHSHPLSSACSLSRADWPNCCLPPPGQCQINKSCICLIDQPAKRVRYPSAAGLSMTCTPENDSLPGLPHMALEFRCDLRVPGCGG